MDGASGGPAVGSVIDRRYSITSAIADGGMATVYRATDLRLDRTVALKVMRPDLARDPGFVTRFMSEARAVARISHPNVVAVFDQGTDGPHVFLAMEYVPSTTLRDLLGQRGRLSPGEAFGVLGPVLSGLAAAHRAGIAHRDVKPENVLLSETGQIKVVDFGLARLVDTEVSLTRTGVLLGTLSYLAPEQVGQHGTTDARADVYAAGIMLYEMLTGRKPHTGATPVEIIYKHVHVDVPPPSLLVPGLPPAVDALVAAATRRDPAGRPPDAAAFLALLESTARSLTPADLAGDAAADAGATTTALAAPAMAGPASGGGATVLLAAGGGPGVSERARPERTLVAPEMPMEMGGPSPGGGGFGVSAGGRRGAPSPRRRWRPSWGIVAFITALVVIGGVVGGVWLVQSNRSVTVPSLTGHQQADAQSQASSAGLHVQLQQVYNPTVPAGSVISTQPGAGTQVKRGSTLTLVVSKGPQPVPVPNVVGESQDTATNQLEQAGFAVNVGAKVTSDTVPKGSVVSENPSGSAPPGSVISLTVSTGPPTFPLPDVTGKSEDDAKQILSQAGFTNVTVVGGGFLGGNGTVFAETPSAGSMQPHSAQITLYASFF